MSGHSKWSTIKRAKGANDAKRGAAFTKLANNITTAVREGGGGDPNFNFRLRLSIDKAREANMPKDNIQRSIDRGLGKGGEAALESVVLEGLCGGAAVMVEAVTDNKNRTAGLIRTTFDKHGGTIGMVNYLFTHYGEIEVDPSVSAETVFNRAIEAGASDVEDNFIYTEAHKLHELKEKLSDLKLLSADLVYRPNKETIVKVGEPEKLISLLDALESLDDVSKVYTNAIFENNQSDPT